MTFSSKNTHCLIIEIQLHLEITSLCIYELSIKYYDNATTLYTQLKICCKPCHDDKILFNLTFFKMLE